MATSPTEKRTDNQSEEIFGQTPWQTVGPFFHGCLPWVGAADSATGSDRGARLDLLPDGHRLLMRQTRKDASGAPPVCLHGQVLDGESQPVPDALLEFWQADPGGEYRPSFEGFGRCATDADGFYRYDTVWPGAVTDDSGRTHAPQILVGVFARGVIKRFVTKVYFAGAEENAGDPTLSVVPADRRATLIAEPTDDGGWHFPIILQGDRETVFFRC